MASANLKIQYTSRRQQQYWKWNSWICKYSNLHFPWLPGVPLLVFCAALHQHNHASCFLIVLLSGKTVKYTFWMKLVWTVHRRLHIQISSSRLLFKVAFGSPIRTPFYERRPVPLWFTGQPSSRRHSGLLPCSIRWAAVVEEGEGAAPAWSVLSERGSPPWLVTPS